MSTIVTIIHDRTLSSREPHVRHLIESFAACGTSVAIVDGPAPPLHDAAKLASLVSMDVWKVRGGRGGEAFEPMLREIKVRNLSNALKHAAALQHVAHAGRQAGASLASWHVVLEDDAMVGDAPALLAACEAAPSDADIVFFGLPARTPHPTDGSMRFDALEDLAVVPSCDCYAVRLRTATFLSTSFLPVRFATHVHLSWLLASCSIKAYSSAPNLSIDGSKLGVFVSSIETNNRLVFNPDYAFLANSCDTDAVVARVETMRFGGHPDVRALLGVRLADAGRHEAARDAFVRATDGYVAEGALLGMDTLYLRRYLDVHRHLQCDLPPDAAE